MAEKKKDPLLIRALVGSLSLKGKMEPAEFLVALPFVLMVGMVCFLYIVANLTGGSLDPLLFLAYGVFAVIALIPQAKRLRDIGLPAPLAWLAGCVPILLPLILPNLDPENPLRNFFWEALLLAWIVFLAAAPSRKVSLEEEEEEAEPEEEASP
ncbi:MAG: hypothetical protein LBJ82_05885, partial [Deltaproteobacteria bacterium]|nr:hypothetical protein [Deltaproteobacteria bacterium]